MKKHEFVLRKIYQSGFRVEYQLIFNGKVLFGKVVQTKRKGKTVWQTHWNNKSIDRYDPQWLCRRNNLSVIVPIDHPAMWNVKEAA